MSRSARFYGSATWANSAAQDTEQSIDPVSLPGRDSGQGYTVSVKNPSAVTALTVKLYSKETFDDDEAGAPENIYLTEFSIPANTTKQFLVEGWLGSLAGRITLSNDTVLGVADGFTAHVVVREV